MMWNWFIKMLGKDERPKRKKVLVDIPYEQHSFSMEHFVRTRAQYDVDEALTSNTLNEPETVVEMDIANK
ncbi:MAG: hypothetical protein ACRDCT_06005 [Shewanella sp.]|uniref:Uncharacterized protein n=1 Tax=Shewanella cutis TaxID=2766780 RepID=A0ABS9QQ92_9GAMM|nr:hypothetical protein [Shewanella sp. PS-2]MCG9962497.1 hypothetical protein [Shewanella sp. PS-2]